MHPPPLPPLRPRDDDPLPPHVAAAKAEAAAKETNLPENATAEQLLRWQCELLAEVRDAVRISTQERENMWSTAKTVAILSFIFSVIGAFVLAAFANMPRNGY